MKLSRIIFLLSGILILSGCALSRQSGIGLEYRYPELPDNEHCYQKIAEYNSFVENPANRKKTEVKSEDGKTYMFTSVSPEFSPEAYLGILIGRGAVEEYSVCMDKAQKLKLWKTFECRMPDCLLWVTGGKESVGLKDYFNFRDETHLAVVTFYYRSSDREKFQAWLRRNVPVEGLPRRSAKEK